MDQIKQNFIQGKIGPALKPRKSNYYPKLPDKRFKPLESKPISRFTHCIIWFFGAKHCSWAGMDLYLFRGKMYCLPSKTKTSG